MTPDQIKAAREILAFYLEAGVDVALGETPVDRFAEPAAPTPSPVSSPSVSEPARDQVVSHQVS